MCVLTCSPIMYDWQIIFVCIKIHNDDFHFIQTYLKVPLCDEANNRSRTFLHAGNMQITWANQWSITNFINSFLNEKKK